MNKYGHFSDDGREFIVTRPDTPRPWINYLSGEKYCALCSQTGGGYSFYETAGYNSITREYPSMVLLRDRPGRFVYLDKESGEYWNINWQPVAKNATAWQSRHGMGYTKISSTYSDIEGRITYFVPLHDPIEMWMVELLNTGDKPRRLSSFASIEWSLGNYIYNLTESTFASLFNEVHYQDGTIFATTRFWNVSPTSTVNPNIRWDKWAFMTSNIEPVAFDTLTEEYMGLYRGWQNPLAVERG
jgi:cellobiose phosphorylase